MPNGSGGGVDRVTAGALSASGAPRPVLRRSEASGKGDLRFGVGVIDPVCVGPLGDRGRPFAVCVGARLRAVVQTVGTIASAR